MWEYNYSAPPDELHHHGIKGMKWGVRRNLHPSSGGRLSSLKKSRPKEDIHEDYANRHSKKSVKSMSDKELRERINRLQMEQQYKQLTSAQVKVGKSVVGGILTNAAKETAKNYVFKYMTKGIDLALDSAYGSIKGAAYAHRRS